MQGQGGTINSFPETVNIDEGSSPNDTSIHQPNSLHNMLNPVENRLSSSSGTMHGNTTTPNVQRFSGWSAGEPSSRVRTQNQVMQDVLNHHLNDDGTKIERGWPSFGAHVGAAPSSEERRFEPANAIFPGRLNTGRSGNQVRSGPIFLQGSSSNHSPQNVNPNEGFISSSGNGRSGTGTGIGLNVHNLVGLEREQISNASVSSDNVGSSSGSSNHVREENIDGSGSSLGNWGLSCKRKVLEGTSAQSYSADTSSCFQQMENVAWNSDPSHNDASSSLSLSTPSWNFLTVGPPDQPNPRLGLGMRGVITDAFTSSTRRANAGNQPESLPYNLSSTGVTEHSSFGSHAHSRASPFGESVDLSTTGEIAGNSSSVPTQPHIRTTSVVPRYVNPFPWNGTSSLRAANSPSSTNFEERAAALRDEPNIRNIPRNNTEHFMLVPATEMRNVAQESTGWNLASGNISTSEGMPSSSRPGPSSSIHPLSTHAWIPPHNPPSHNRLRLSDFAPWSLFSPFDSESGGRSGHFPSSSSGPSASSQETVVPSGSNIQGNNQPYPRSAFILERQDDDVLGMPHSLRALAADIEGRHRLISEIRQVLTAMRRGENLRIEDYMVFDPFIYHGMAETHDRHRDMRLDVDNMSYEELLALEERIGDVSTGLNEETIMKLMKQKRYSSTATDSTQETEPCCICQEEYEDGDDTGVLDCGHDFHTNCIKEWLMLKNMCPVCKTTGLLK